ncbi:MAG: cation diffusion facilitator family transporter [Actinomycetaceae bacterium]|nr:cation diffusion facilitator family transporter [Arcanobacterium sp.]MDD7505813.1 cation diffusion facilitator family transporter [Actinomycetaceae bacterium]MDY6142876.1 cation diffusion facilitator family transporter [Arcanobacterium sp.]
MHNNTSDPHSVSDEPDKVIPAARRRNVVAGDSSQSTPQPDLSRFAWLSLSAAVLTIVLKVAAYWLTDSVSLLSDAMESVVNLVAAIVALIALKLAARPADSRYTFGRSKAEYFSAAIEGAMIFGAAALIIHSSVLRLLNPIPITNVGIGLAVSVIAAAVNGAVGIILIRAGKRNSSPTLEADGKHLLTDVITTAGVIFGVVLVALTGWDRLDPIVAILVAINIIWIGIGLIRSALSGLMDVTLPDHENQAIIDILARFTSENVTFHGLQTRQSGQLRFVRVDVQVPGAWTVAQGHAFGEEIEDAVRERLPGSFVTVHVEPIEDPQSYEDIPEGYIPLTTTLDALQPRNLAR